MDLKKEYIVDKFLAIEKAKTKAEKDVIRDSFMEELDVSRMTLYRLFKKAGCRVSPRQKVRIV